ncbi:hypothetical protein Syun_030893 [Stephania yunnanensis]|uniref:RRM domain-containing protein n=1 Tax=Stephania yunnanensis TaxID=152371 RepID=A0AAP0HG56_9MAGN
MLAGLSAVSGLSVSSRWSLSLRLVVLPGLSAVSGLAVSLVSPSRRAGLRHRPSTLALSANTHDQELFSFHRDHSPCDGFEEVLNCYNVFAQLLRLSDDKWTMNVPAVDGGLLKPDVVEGTDDEVPYFVEIKRTIPKGSVQSKDFKTKKIFVGGVPTTVSEDEFKNFFSKHGRVVEHHIIRDHNTNRSRGTPGLGGRLGGYGGYSGGSELGGGYGGFGGSGLGAYRGESSLGYSILANESLPFNSLSCRLFKLLDLDITGGLAKPVIEGFHFLMQELSEALMSSPDENGDFVKLESSLSLKGKNAAMVLCWLLGNGCLFAWNEVSHCKVLTLVYRPFALGTLSILAYNEAKINTRRRNLIGFILFFISSTAVLVLLCVLLYAYVFGKLLIVKYYRAKALPREPERL